MSKIKEWLVSDVGIRSMIVLLIVLSVVFVPYLFGIMLGFGGPIFGIFGSWIMGLLLLIIGGVFIFLFGLVILGCITYIQYGEYEPLELMEDIVVWFEDMYNGLIDRVQGNS